MLSEIENPAFTDHIRQTLYDHEKYYAPGDSVYDGVSDKYFTGIVGPFKTGKTYLVDEALLLEPEIIPINTTTTRARKHGDPEGFKTGVSFTYFRDAVNDGAVVNYSVIPGGDIYGTFPEDFTATYNIGPFLPSSIPQIERAGFKDHRFIYIVTAGDLWRGFVEKSRDDHKFETRVLESLDSTEFALHNLDRFSFIENTYEPTGTIDAAQKISQLALFRAQETMPKEQAKIYLEQMHAAAKNLIG